LKKLTLFITGIFLLFSFIQLKEEIGLASYYSSQFEGRRTASGEVFTQKKLTAAHKTLPFGTVVKVTNLKNDSIVIVKINDRLSKRSGHSIDLTLTAAKQLNFVRNGSTKVKIQPTN
jgi:rare lipoprotein A